MFFFTKAFYEMHYPILDALGFKTGTSHDVQLLLGTKSKS